MQQGVICNDARWIESREGKTIALKDSIKYNITKKTSKDPCSWKSKISRKFK